MKILYAAHGNYWGSTWPYAFIDCFITETLKGLGHEVKIFDIFSRADPIMPYYREYAKNKNLSQTRLMAILDERATVDLPLEILEFKPDLLLHIVGRIAPRVLKAVKKMQIKSAIWFLDDPQEIDRTNEIGAYYDYVFTVDPSCVDPHKQAGSKNSWFLPLGCFPPFDKKIDVPGRYKSDICFIGVPFPERVEFFDGLADFLKDFSVKIIGGGATIGSTTEPWLWKKKLKRLDVLEKFILDEIVFPDEAAKYYNGAKISLNIHRGVVDVRFEKANINKIKPLGVSGRTFEIAGCGAFQLIDQERLNYKVHFEEGREIISFKDTDDFKKKVEYYLNHEKERQEVGDAAQKRAYSEHTYEKRLKQLLEYCQ